MPTTYFERSRNRWVAENYSPKARARGMTPEQALEKLELKLASLSVEAPVSPEPLPSLDNIREMLLQHGNHIWSTDVGGRTAWAETAANLVRIADDLMGRPKLTSINAPMLHDLVDDLVEERDLSNATVNRYLAALHKLMKAAVSFGVPLSIPLFPYRSEGGHTPRILRGDEQARMLEGLAAISEDSADAMRVFLATGARPNEVFKAQPSWVKPGWLIVPPAFSKTKKERQIALTPETEAILRARLPWSRLDLHRYRQDWNKVRTAIGLADDPRFTPYMLRHTWASRALALRIDPVTIQRALGHSKLETTLRYLEVAPESVASAANAVAEGWLRGSGPKAQTSL